jgi:hypothetical protein
LIDTSEKPRLPVIGEFVRGVGTLHAIEQPPPSHPPLEYIFAEISARKEMRRRGHLIRKLDTLNDFYGRGTSVEMAIQEMKKLAELEEITADSEVELVVVRVVSYFRAHPDSSKNVYDKRFVNMETLPHGSQWNVPDDEEAEVWSSQRGDLR